MEIPEEMIESLLPAVREQMEAPQTACVKACMERLTGREGLDEQTSLELVAQALAIVVNAMMLTGRPFDMEKYKALLNDLPCLPDEGA